MITLKTEAAQWLRIFQLLHLKKGNLPLVDVPVLQVPEKGPVVMYYRGKTAFVKATIHDAMWHEKEGHGVIAPFVSSRNENRQVDFIKRFVKDVEQVRIVWGDDQGIALYSEYDEYFSPSPFIDKSNPPGWTEKDPTPVSAMTQDSIKYKGPKTGKEIELSNVFYVNAEEMLNVLNKAQWMNQTYFTISLEADKLAVMLGDKKQKDKEHARAVVPVNFVKGNFTGSYNDQLEHVFRNCEGEVKCYQGGLLWMHYEWENMMTLDVGITPVMIGEVSSEQPKPTKPSP